MAEDVVQANSGVARRNRLRIAIWMIALGAGGVVVISAIAILAAARGAQETSGVIQQIFPALIGLFGSWVGTVLAFYFGQDNFDAASQQNRSMIRETVMRSGNPNDQTPLRDIMVPVASLMRKSNADGNLPNTLTMQKLDDLLSDGDSRLFILGSGNVIEYVVHRMVVDAYLRKRKDEDAGYDPVSDSFANMLGYPAFKARVDSDIMVFESETATVRSAKQKLASNRQAWDVIVTRDGSKSSEMTGWVANYRLTDL